MFGGSEEFNVGNIQNNGLNIVGMICDGFSQPVQILIRPFYGTRYFPVPVTFMAGAMMLLLPAIAATFNSVTHMIPFLNIPGPRGMFGLADFARLYFLASAIHGVRQWRRMLDMSREEDSEYEGPALFFFGWLPKGLNFFFVRIVWEPALVLVLSIVLQDVFIIQGPLSLYLKLAAFALMMKNFIVWFRAWEYMRKILDMRHRGPIIAKIADGTATVAETEPLHIASIPKNLDPEIREATIAHIARDISGETER